jgi:YD repeat-containing protein
LRHPAPTLERSESYSERLDCLDLTSLGVYREIGQLLPGSALSYEYDANGNRTRHTSGLEVTDYSYDAADELTSVSRAFTQTYIYDLDGNRVSAGSDTFAYDWRNRLTSIIGKSWPESTVRIGKTSDRTLKI